MRTCVPVVCCLDPQLDVLSIQIRRGPDTPVGKSVRTAISEEKDEEKEVGEEEGEEDEDDDEEEEADNSITSSITSSTGSRGGSNKRKAEQARLVGMIEKKEEEKKKKKKKKKKDDPQWQMVNMFMKDKKGGEGDGEAARLAEVLLRKDMRDEEKARREEEKERREEEKERQNQEERDMKFLLDTAKWMKENNVTEDGLPSYVKQKWDKLNKKVDD
eukprot:evm.model.NODE_17275_length_21369_cov_25.336750.6